ncbi:TfoX/Sxy family protein [Methanobrevibacter sp. DSM 116169]|uniref:TfoX/Sxy family protein n=1 Tax=Methanobrevibacter sp. DSM 116169 TaxID=3242727 RepID=UPI0038FCA597
MNKLSKLPNIGKIAEKQLNDVGILTKEDLKEIGSKEAWLKIKEVDNTACLSKLCALEGAIQNIRWFDLSKKDKENLKNFYNNYK